MKKLLASIVGLAALALPSVATAQSIPVTLCGNGLTMRTFIEYKGSNGADHVFEVSGYSPSASKDILISGTMLLSTDVQTFRWGWTLQNSMGGFAAVNWEFTTDYSLSGTGTFQWQVNTSGGVHEPTGALTVSAGACVAGTPSDSAALGK